VAPTIWSLKAVALDDSDVVSEASEEEAQGNHELELELDVLDGSG